MTNHFVVPTYRSNTTLLDCVHAGPRYDLLVLVSQSRNLEEGVHAVTL